MSLWKLAGILIIAFLALGLLGVIIKALRFLIWIAILIAVVAAILGALGRKNKT